MPLGKDSIRAKSMVIAYPMKPIQQDSVVVHSLVENYGLEGRDLYKPNYDGALLWIAIWGGILLLIMQFITQRSNNERNILQCFFSLKKPYKMEFEFNEMNLLQHLFSFLSVGSIVYYFISKNFSFPFWSTLVCSYLLVAGFLLLRLLFILIIGFIMNGKEVKIKHIGLIFAINKPFGLFSYILLLVVLLIESFDYNAVILSFSVLFGIKVFSHFIGGYGMLREYKFSIFHSLLYLCTLEILPVLYLLIGIQVFN